MTITTSLEPRSTTSMPGATVGLALRLHNPELTAQRVGLRPTGALAEYTVVEQSSVDLGPESSIEVPTAITIPATLPPGAHSSEIAVSIDDVDVASAEVTVEIAAAAAYVASIRPESSRSASVGRHRIAVENRGNVAIDVTLTATSDDATIGIEPATAQLSVAAGENTVVDIAVTPNERFWNGPPIAHPFEVVATGSDGETFVLHGEYEQRPRLRPWWGPALAGAAAALVLGAILWFAVLAPWVRSTADDAAEDANAAEQAALDAKIEELDASAAEAEELPLGEPADLRLSVDADTGDTGTDTFRVGTSVVWSVTDIIFQNPTGAAGQVVLKRGDDILLESELANFRDLDFHLVAPFVFEGGSSIELEVTCDAPGPAANSCTVGATLAGFTDED